LLPRSRCYTSRYRDVIRAKIVLLASEGMANDAIAARLDTPRQIVSKWRRRDDVRLPTARTSAWRSSGGPPAFVREFIFDIKDGKHRILETGEKEKAFFAPACKFRLRLDQQEEVVPVGGFSITLLSWRSPHALRGTVFLLRPPEVRVLR
jgi:Homeodomain-like domain